MSEARAVVPLAALLLALLLTGETMGAGSSTGAEVAPPLPTKATSPTLSQRGRVLLLAIAFALPAGAANAEELEALPAEGASADIRASKGVVFVDLYADW